MSERWAQWEALHGLGVRKGPQRFRVFIHGHGHRHVYGSDDPRKITRWIAGVRLGLHPEHLAHSDISVEKKYDWGWAGLEPPNRDALMRAVQLVVEGGAA